jgi:preprotein translocase subunit SecG
VIAAILTLTNFVVVIHIGVSVGLVVLVLLHSGRGGGVSEMFGGVQSAAAGSTVVERNLDRITVAVAVVFTFTTIMLAIRLQ